MKTWLYCAVLLGLTSLTVPAIAQTPTKAPEIEEFNIVGAEPFWNVKVGKKGIVYSPMDGKARTFPYVAPIAAQGRTLESVRVYRLQGNNNLLILKKVDHCGDTMSDKQYPYSATLILGNTVFDGCAERPRNK
jgi:uncharacterized membrane protein